MPVILVEGESDRAALTTLARRRHHDLAALGIDVVAIGGSRSLGRHLADLVPRGIPVAGLVDAAEAPDYRRALDRAGVTGPLERHGFHTCHADLEDELLRALGTAAALRVVEQNGDLPALEILRRQPQWRDRSEHDRLRRLIGTTSGRKIRYGALLTEALDLDRVPRPLAALLDHALAVAGAPR